MATDIDTLEKELASIAARIKTVLFPGGERHGHLCCVISDEAYGAKIADPAFELEQHEPEEPEAYNPEITDDTPDHQRRTMEADWERYKKDVTRYNAVQEVLVNQIAGAIDLQHLNDTSIQCID